MNALMNIKYPACLIACLVLLCGCSDDFDHAAKQAKDGANKIAIASYKAYLDKQAAPNSKTAAAHYEIGVLLCRENEKEEALISFKKAAEAGYPAENLKIALRDLAGDFRSSNHETTRAVLREIRGVNPDFTQYADAQLLRFKNIEASALALVSEAKINLENNKFYQAREALAKARTLVPGIGLPGIKAIQEEIDVKESAYDYGRDMRSVSHFFDVTRTVPTGANYSRAAFTEYTKLQKADADKLKEINDAVRNKAVGSNEAERKENEATPGRRYQDLLNKKFALKFSAALPAYDTARGGYDLSGQYEPGHCHSVELVFPVIKIEAQRAKALEKARVPVQVEIVFNVYPQNISKTAGREEIVAGCKVTSAQAVLDGQIAHFTKK